MMDQFFAADRAIAEGQNCARLLLGQTGSRSTWCIVTRKSFWGPSYFFPGDEEELRQKLRHGHKILLIFAATRRRALGSCSEYQAVDPSTFDGMLRRFAPQAMRRAA
ncbi:MAG: hypothetical protein WBD10_05100 [Acidobacteriaceae bacterium]